MMILLQFEHVGVSRSGIWQKSQLSFIYNLFIYWKICCTLAIKKQCNFDNYLKSEEKWKRKKVKNTIFFFCMLILFSYFFFVIPWTLCIYLSLVTNISASFLWTVGNGRGSVICWSERHLLSLIRSQTAGVSVCKGGSQTNEPLALF